MSRNALNDLSQYLDVANEFGGQLAALGMKARQGQPQGLAPRKPLPTPQPKPAVQAQLDPKVAARNQYNLEMKRMFLPVEQGGSLITTATPVNMVGGGLPDGHSITNLPQKMQEHLAGQLPDGVKAIGFHPGRMSDMQFKALDYFNQQRDTERQADADKAIAQAVNPLEP